jgi:sec-independent protein translocase protein TatB
MFGIGFWEMLMIGGLVLVAVGPERLPSMIKTIARFYRQARRTAQDLRQSTGIDDVLRDDELKELASLRNQKIQLMGPQAFGKPPAPAKPTALAQQKAVLAEPAAGKPVAPEGTMPAGKPLPFEKPGVGKPSAPAASIMDSSTVLRGLTLEERRRELPMDGVDVVVARARLGRSDVRDGEAA